MWAEQSQPNVNCLLFCHWRFCCICQHSLHEYQHKSVTLHNFFLCKCVRWCVFFLNVGNAVRTRSQSNWVPGSVFTVTADSFTHTDCITVIHAKTDSAVDQLCWEELSYDSFLHICSTKDVLWALLGHWNRRRKIRKCHIFPHTVGLSLILSFNKFLNYYSPQKANTQKASFKCSSWLLL